MVPLSTFPIQQAIPTYHIYGNFLQRASGNSQVMSGPGEGSFYLLDEIDLFCTSLSEGAEADLSIGASDGSTDKVPFFRGFVYATSQAVFQWRGSIVLFGGQGLWLSASTATWTVGFHALALPDWAGQQIAQG